MLSTAHSFATEHHIESSSATSESNQVEQQSNYLVYYVSPIFVRIEQFKNDLSATHQHEIHAMTELNEQFSLMLDHLHQLEVQNAKYFSKLAVLQRKAFLASVTGEHNSELNHIQCDVMEANYVKVAYESEFELLQLQSQMYQQVGQFGQASLDQQRNKLESELQQSSSVVIELRKSYESMEQTVGSLRATIKEKMREYISLSKQWSTLRKQSRELRFSIQMMNVQVQFSNTLYTKFDIFSLDMDDFAAFWKLEWEQIIKKIRNDFQVLYGAIHQESITYYEKKSKEITVDLERLVQSHKDEQQEYALVVEQLELEYEHVSRAHSHDLQLSKRAEETLFELESEFKALQILYREKFEAQSKEFDYLHETVVTLASSVEEAQRRKMCLENEIIIYRHLLGKGEIKKTIETSVKKTRTYTEKNQYIGSIYIECPLECTYISISNQSNNATANISRWQLTRRVDSKTTLQYTIPNGVEIKPGSEIKVFSKLGTEIMRLSSNEREFSSDLNQVLVVNDVYSMGIGATIETYLFNERGQEIATCIQTAEADWEEYE